MKIFAAGHPRGATGYVSKLLTVSKYAVGHEVLSTNGISSWYNFLQDKSLYNLSKKIAWRPSFIPLTLSEFEFLHIFRNPFISIESIYTENEGPVFSNTYGSFIFRDNILNLQKYTQPIDRAIYSFLKWHELIDSTLTNSLPIKVETDIETIYDFAIKKANYDISKEQFLEHSAKINTNYNSRRRTTLSRDDWKLADKQLVLELNAFAKKIGYFADVPWVLDPAERKLITHYNNNVNYYTPALSSKLSSIYTNIKADKVLDLGCGTGKSVPFYNSIGAKEITGVDISNERLKLAKKAYPQYNFLLQDLNIFIFEASEKYDLITCFETLEHLKSPEKVVEEVKTLLVENGIFIGSVPINMPYKAHLKVFKTKEDVEKLGVQVVHTDSQHFYFFYRKTL